MRQDYAWNEYIFGGPYRTRERAEESMEDSLCDGEIDLSAKPRVVALKNHRGKVVSYAFVVTDTSLRLY